MAENKMIDKMAKLMQMSNAVTYEPNARQIELSAQPTREKYYVTADDGHLTIDYTSLGTLLYNAGYRKQEWISVEERLPDENEVVLIWVGGVRVARFLKGITEEERQKMKSGELPNPKNEYWCSSAGYTWIERSKIYTSSDVHGNNLVPYSWEEPSGNMKWFGQKVNYWMPLPEPPETKGEN